MPIIIIFVLLTISSCGSKSDTGSQSQSVNQSQQPVSTSYYVKSSAALVECNDKTRGYLAYIQDTAQFEACLDSGWTVVDVKGKDGSNGKDGTNGIAGPNGRDGSNGSSGKDGAMMATNQWYDPISQKSWVMTNFLSTVASWTNASSACTGSYRVPTAAEIQIALIHGMKVVAQGLVNAPTQIIASDGHSYLIADGTQGSSTTAAQFCVSK